MHWLLNKWTKIVSFSSTGSFDCLCWNCKCYVHKATYLEYEWWTGFQLQHARRAQRFKLRVRVVTKSLIHHQYRANAIHDKTNLIWTATHFWKAFVRSSHRGRQTYHYCVVENCAVLQDKHNKEGQNEMVWQKVRQRNNIDKDTLSCYFTFKPHLRKEGEQAHLQRFQSVGN